MDIPREWYSIADLAERWGCSLNHIEHLLESKQLYACCRLKTPTNAHFLQESDGKLVTTKHIDRIEGQHVIVEYDRIEWKWNGGDMSRCPLYSQELDRYYLVENHRIEKNELIVTKKAVLRFEVENEAKTDTESPFRLIVEQQTRLLQKRNGGKKPTYLELIKSLSKLSSNDDQVGAVITGIDHKKKKVYLHGDDSISFKTIQNWMSNL